VVQEAQESPETPESPDSRESKTAFIALLVMGFFVLLIVGLAAAVGASAVVQPGCARCHMKGDFATATEAGSHSAIACKSCHVPDDVLSRTAWGAHTVSRTLIPMGGSVGRSSSGVPDESCLNCHATVKDGVSTANGLRIDHSRCAVGSECTDCHAATAHGSQVGWVRTYTMDKCLHCHAQGDSMVKCDTCHEERRPDERVVVGPWRVTHGANWRKTHGMGDQFTCSACHPQGYCTKCHGPGLPHGKTFMIDHSDFAKTRGAKCYTCHDKRFCTSCHGVEMPHPSGFTKQHSAIVKKTSDEVCRTCHSQRDCTECHIMHIHPGGAAGSSSAAPIVEGN
jgi:hypothetical protein